MGTALPVLPADGLTGSGTFMYTCHRCRRCCSDKRIRVNPYEVYRLARHLGTSTTEFLSVYTICGGTELARHDDGSCVFLTEAGCGVHSDRPLVCRLYPLGRRVTPGEPDTYHLAETHPESAGVFSDGGTVASFLASQGARPFEEAGDRYFALLLRIGEVMSERAAGDPREYDAASEVLSDPPESQDWLDIDAVIQSADGEPTAPASPENAMARHIELLERQFLERPLLSDCSTARLAEHQNR
jgi:uncharacterized protein